jgi:hypothetical protein
MSVASTLGLGLRLAIGRGRHGLMRLLLMTAGVGIGVALVVGGLGITPALDARRAREFARIPAVFATAEGDFENGIPPYPMLWARADDQIAGHDVVAYRMAHVGKDPAPLPPGVSRFPKPGEKVVSPALADLFATPAGQVAAERYPGPVVGTVGPEGLLYPGELVVYEGTTPEALRETGAIPAVGFGNASGYHSEPIPLDAKVLILLGVIGLLVPTLVFVITSTRLSAASRERRLAAMRLVGATPAETRLMAATETGLSTVAGSVLGVVLFFAFRPLVASLSLAGYSWFPSDMAPPVGSVLLVLVAAPALAVLATLVGLRRLIVTPLGVARRGRVRRAGPVRLILPAAGLVGLGLCWLARDTIDAGGPGALLALGASFLLVLAGVALVAPWLGAAAAPLLTRRQRGMGALMGARRIQADPTAAGRVVGAVALLVCAAGVIVALLPPALADRTGQADLAAGLPPASVAVLAYVPMDSAAIGGALRRLEGVTAAAPLSSLPGREEPGGPSRTAGDYLIADCAQIGPATGLTFARCGPDTVFVPAGKPTPDWVRPGANVRIPIEDGRVVPIRIPPTLERMALPDYLPVILPPQAVPGWARPTLTAYTILVATDGTPAAVERVRNVVAEQGLSARVTTPAESRARANADVRHMISLVDLGIAAALAIALANLLVVTIDHVAERRRPVAVLAASGVPLGVLRRSVAVEIGVPLATAIAMATATSLVVAAIVASILDHPMVVPFVRMGALFGLAAAAVAVVTALTFPSLARAARPETLQAE